MVCFDNIEEATLSCSENTDHTYLKGVYPTTLRSYLTPQNIDNNQKENKVSIS